MKAMKQEYEKKKKNWNENEELESTGDRWARYKRNQSINSPSSDVDDVHQSPHGPRVDVTEVVVCQQHLQGTHRWDREHKHYSMTQWFDFHLSIYFDMLLFLPLFLFFFIYLFLFKNGTSHGQQNYSIKNLKKGPLRWQSPYIAKNMKNKNMKKIEKSFKYVKWNKLLESYPFKVRKWSQIA